MSATWEGFSSVADGLDVLAATISEEGLGRFEPLGGALSPGASLWDHVQHGAALDFNQSDCNWFAFEARAAQGAGRFAGILALHRTGARLAALARPRFDARPLFLSVLYDLGSEPRRAWTFERPVEGTIDPARFSFVSNDRREQLVHGDARDFRATLPAPLGAFFSYEGPAFALRTGTDAFELELFLRPEKDPVAYGPQGSTALASGRTVIHYVQRPRLDLLGLLRLRGPDRAWGAPIALRGDATQDRHWLTLTNPNLRWLWFMGRFDDGRECMIYAMRTADGGRHAPADAGRPAGGGAWIIERDGRARAIEEWSLTPEAHVDTRRGRVPTRFRVSLPGEGIRLVLAHDHRTFVPTRALGELIEAGIWESPCTLIEGEGVRGGRFWVDVMPPWGGA